jgi:polysaccharide biosynthesis protein PslH
MTPASLLTEPVNLEIERCPLRVVLVDEELPYPPTSGKRIRTYNLVRRLAPRHRLTYVCHRNADADEARVAESHFAGLGIRTVIVERSVPPKSGPGFYLRLASNLFSPLPYSVAVHASRQLAAALAEVAAREPVDLWHCEWTPYAQSLRGIAGPRLVMAHNVESVIWQRYHETAEGVLKRWYIRKQWQKFRTFERDILADASLTVAVSPLDAERFRRDLAVPRVDVVDNGVDTSFFRPTSTPRDPKSLLFLGSLDWRPNLDGVVQFLDHVMPTLRKQEPGVKFVVVGRNPPAWLAARLASEPGVALHASVPDVRPYLAAAGVMVVPLRIGGGSRLKILESLACALPVVSTRVGAEGLHLQGGRHLDLVEEVADMTDAIIRAIRDPHRARRQAQVGYEQTIRLYDWAVLADRLERLWLQCAEGSPTTPGRDHS